MKIRPSTALRNEYNEISEYCKREGEPVFITKNGEGDLVVMSIEAYEMREEMLNIRAKLLEAEANRLAGVPSIPSEEFWEEMETFVNGEKQEEKRASC